eukprot:Clim_evm5s31 gene=Clim_evmTU5s31
MTCTCYCANDFSEILANVDDAECTPAACVAAFPAYCGYGGDGVASDYVYPSSGLSVGAIVGIVIAVLVFVALVVLTYCYCRRRKTAVFTAPGFFGQPGVQAKCGQPGAPVSYGQPGAPVSYGQPGVPVNYGQPGVPVNYGQPGVPVNYGQPGVPVNYGQPAVPVNHGQLDGQYPMAHLTSEPTAEVGTSPVQHDPTSGVHVSTPEEIA